MIPTYSEGRGRLWRTARVPAEASILAMGAATARWRQPPDFLIIGGRRCGSTSLYYGLMQHPAVLPLVLSAGWLPLKEHRKGTRWLDRPRRGGAWYRGHFPTDLARQRTSRRAGAAITGEATPWYLAAPGAAERAHAEAPDARLIVVLRDPVERTYSQFLEQRKRGHEPLEDFAAALALEEYRRRHGVELADGTHRSAAFANEHLTYRRQSEYADRLAPWLRRYRRDQLLAVRAEDLFADSVAVLQQVSTFLGLPPYEFEAEHRNSAKSAAVPKAPPVEVAEALRRHFAPHQQRLEALLGQSFSWS